jgi:excisionase family DNA binding protein
VTVKTELISLLNYATIVLVDLKGAYHFMATEKIPISTREVAKMLGVTPRTVVRLVERNEISGFRVGDVWRFYREDIQQYIEEQTRGKQKQKG